MLSANRLFGTPIPPEDERAALEVEFHCRVIDEMLPYLKQGHDEEAQKRAQALIDRVLDYRPEGEP